MGIAAWILFGLIIGVVAKVIDPNPKEAGVPGAVMLGVVGGLMGGLLWNLFFNASVTGLNLSSVVLAVGGSLLLLFMGRVLRRI